MSSLHSRLAALRQLRGPRELALFTYLTVFAAAVPLLMRLSMPRVARVVSRPARGTRPPQATVERFAALQSLAVTVGYPLVRPGCLTRGITLFWFLRRAGFEVELLFGVDARDREAADGHCWLVLDGEPLLEKVDPRARFAEVLRLPRTAAA